MPTSLFSFSFRVSQHGGLILGEGSVGFSAALQDAFMLLPLVRGV